MEDTTTTDLVELEGSGAGVHEGIAVDSEGNALTEEQVVAMRAAQPEASAEVQAVDNSTDPEVESTVAADKKDLIDWAKRKGGFDTDDLSPGAIRALEIARTTEQEYTRDRQKQSELRRQLEQAAYQPYQAPYQQPYAPQPQQEQVLTGYDVSGQPLYTTPTPQPYYPTAPVVDPKIAMLEFQVNHKDYEVGNAIDQEMGRVVGSNPTFWASHLDEAYSVAKANLSSSDIESRIEQARKDERTRLSSKSQAAQPNAQSVQPAPVASIRTAAEAERFINTATKEEYNEKLPELQAALGMELRPRK